MRFGYVALSVSVVALLASGCATKRYGRLQPVTTAEQQVYSCRDIDIEIAKVEGFRQQVSDGARINGASVMGFLGDWGIGNANEKNAAERTATQRMNDLLALRATKGCSRFEQAVTPAAPPAPPAPSSVDPAEARQMGNKHVQCDTCRASN